MLKHSPNNLFAHIAQTATYIALGRDGEARQQAEKLLELDPAFSLDELAKRMYIKDKAEAERYTANLRKAGLK